MSALRALGRWVANWRNGATIAFSVLVGVIVLSFFEARAARDQAFESLTDSRAAAARRIDAKDVEIADLRQQLINEREAALRRGSEPVTSTIPRPRPASTTTTTARRSQAGRSSPPTSSSTTAPPASTTTQRPPSTTTTQPPTTTTTEPPCSVSLPGVCL